MTIGTAYICEEGAESTWHGIPARPFTNPLQDVESYDPVLNPVLNREVRRTGGRVLITLGDQDIDLSPSFVIFLSTRDPTVRMGATWPRLLWLAVG